MKNTLGEVLFNLIRKADNEYHDQFHNVNDVNEINRLRKLLKKIANYGNHGRNALHTWEVQSFTTPNTFYTVKQLLNGDFTCSCPSFRYESGLDWAGHCKHQDKVIQNVNNCMDINYGLGATEANRRLTEIAKEGLIR